MRLQLDQAAAKARKLEKRGEFDAAAELYSQILGQFPQNRRIAAALEALIERTGNPPVETLKTLEAAYHRREHAAVVAAGRDLAARFPRSVTLCNIVGAAELALKDAAAAEKSFRRALAIHPQNVDALSNLGVALKAQNRFSEALAAYEAAATFSPGHAGVLFNLANLLREAGRLTEALAAFEDLARARPADAEPRFSVASILQETGRGPEAVEHGLKALAIDPGHARARALVIHQLGHLCDFDRLAAQRAYLDTLGITGQAVEPFALIAIDDAPERCKARAENWARRFHVVADPFAGMAAPEPGERIRVGYFSADVHNHATMYLTLRLFERHDSERFAITLYSYGGKRDAAVDTRLAATPTRYRDVHALSDAEIVALARADGLDIAVDLNGYTKGARSDLFAARLAPVQINYLAFASTMGAPFIDYIVADPVLIPDSHRGYYTEAVITLPDSYQPTDETRPIAEDASSRRDHGLPEAGTVFCAFNANHKIQPRDFAIWMRLLGGVEGSVLWLLHSGDRAEANLMRAASAAGIDPARLVFAPRLPHLPHLARHRHADLFLDTFAYNAHTTASDALWAGLPLVTRIGEQFAARVAASILTAAGLPELITRTDAEYEALALALARDPARLAALRTKLAAGKASAPLFDSLRYTRHLEAAYETAHKRRIDAKPPGPIRISPATS